MVNGAQNDRKSIFEYWNNRIGSKRYSKKLNRLFIEGIEIVALHPMTGRLTVREHIRIKPIKHYLLIYQYTEDVLTVLTVFDSRQDPAKLKKILDPM